MGKSIEEQHYEWDGQVKLQHMGRLEALEADVAELKAEIFASEKTGRPSLRLALETKIDEAVVRVERESRKNRWAMFGVFGATVAAALVLHYLFGLHG